MYEKGLPVHYITYGNCEKFPPLPERRSIENGVTCAEGGCDYYYCLFRGVAQLGSASGWGSEGHGFESRRPDKTITKNYGALGRDRTDDLLVTNELLYH